MIQHRIANTLRLQLCWVRFTDCVKPAGSIAASGGKNLWLSGLPLWLSRTYLRSTPVPCFCMVWPRLRKWPMQLLRLPTFSTLNAYDKLMLPQRRRQPATRLVGACFGFRRGIAYLVLMKCHNHRPPMALLTEPINTNATMGRLNRLSMADHTTSS